MRIKKPPNLRKVKIQTCHTCKHLEWCYEGEINCRKYNYDDIDSDWVCDSWEEKVLFLKELWK